VLLNKEKGDNSMRNMAEPNIPQKPEGAEELEKQGISDLTRALHEHTDPQVRQYAAYLLGKAKNPRAIQPLIEALADFDKSVREQAMLALSTIGKAAIEPLAEAMKEPRWETRYRAAEALGKIADEKAVQPLIQGLRDNRDHVRYMAAKGLHELGDSDAVEPLIILLKDENVYVRLMAVHALGALGGKKVKSALNKALDSEQDEKVKAAMTAALQ
jgi:HEAT repeat protein